MFLRKDADGNIFQFSEDTENLTGWQLHGTGQAHDDGYSLVAKRRLESYEGISFGRGSSENPDRAEAYLFFDARSDDADADGTPDILNGKYELVVLNGADEVQAVIDRGQISQTRQGDPQQLGGADSRGDWGTPFKYKDLGENGEIMGDDWKVGIRLNLDSGNDEFHVGNSDLLAEGYSGRRQN